MWRVEQNSASVFREAITNEMPPFEWQFYYVVFGGHLAKEGIGVRIAAQLSSIG